MRLRVATFNLENLDEPRRGAVPLDERIAVLRPQLLALRADVLCLQEVSAHVRREGHRALRALDRLVEHTPYAAYARTTSVVVVRWPLGQAQPRGAQPVADRRRASALP
jgi:endonuclease/exonuclease/phosphatase family metal-dependent hydrolase